MHMYIYLLTGSRFGVWARLLIICHDALAGGGRQGNWLKPSQHVGGIGVKVGLGYAGPLAGVLPPPYITQIIVTSPYR